MTPLAGYDHLRPWTFKRRIADILALQPLAALLAKIVPRENNPLNIFRSHPRSQRPNNRWLKSASKNVPSSKPYRIVSLQITEFVRQKTRCSDIDCIALNLYLRSLLAISVCTLVDNTQKCYLANIAAGSGAAETTVRICLHIECRTLYDVFALHHSSSDPMGELIPCTGTLACPCPYCGALFAPDNESATDAGE